MKAAKPHKAPAADSANTLPDEPVILPIEDSIDLHTVPAKEVREVVEEYLIEARNKGFHEVRIIHGRGVGVQRGIVRSLLERHPAVESFGDARPEAGGWGATIVLFKREVDGGPPGRN